MGEQSSPLVVIPTFDERENLESIIKRTLVSVPEAHVLVVDDASPDGTGELADALARADSRVHVLHRTGKAGLGAAYVAGFSWGLAHADPRFDLLIEMDADGSHAPEHLPSMLAAARDADVVIGSRWVPGGEVVNWPRRREALSRVANIYTRLALGVSVRDSTAGFRVYRREVLEAMSLSDVASAGYCFQVDMTWRCVQQGRRIVELPITFVEREHGESKMSGAIVREALVSIAGWGAAHRGRQAATLARRALRR